MGIAVTAPSSENGVGVDLQSVAGSAVGLAGDGVVGAGTQRVTIATDDVNLAAIRTAVELIDHLVTAGAGNVDAGTQRVTLADDDPAVVSLALIDNIVGTIDGAFAGDVAVIGGVAESTVPTEVADGDAVAAWFDTFGRLVLRGTDLAQDAISVTDVSPAQMQVLIETGWVALTAPAQETPVLDVRDYENFNVVDIVAAINTSVDLIIWGSLDNANWFVMWSGTRNANGVESNVFSGVKAAYIKCELDAEVGGVAVTVTFQVMCGN